MILLSDETLKTKSKEELLNYISILHENFTNSDKCIESAIDTLDNLESMMDSHNEVIRRYILMRLAGDERLHDIVKYVLAEISTTISEICDYLTCDEYTKDDAISDLTELFYTLNKLVYDSESSEPDKKS